MIPSFARRVIARLPRGRWRAARLALRAVRHPFVDTVEPARLGVRLWIDPADDFQRAIWVGAYQPHVVRFLEQHVRPGAHVLTAGLHVGYIAAIARRLAGPEGRVYSAEPDPVARQYAERNLSLADGVDAPITVLAGGLSDVAATLRLTRSHTMGHSSFAAEHQPAESISVPLVRGDDWLNGARVDVIVLDVEGWELHALRGLAGTLDRWRPVMLVEATPWALRCAGTTRDELTAWLATRGYAVSPVAGDDLLCRPRQA